VRPIPSDCCAAPPCGAGCRTILHASANRAQSHTSSPRQARVPQRASVLRRAWVRANRSGKPLAGRIVEEASALRSGHCGLASRPSGHPTFTRPKDRSNEFFVFLPPERDHSLKIPGAVTAHTAGQRRFARSAMWQLPSKPCAGRTLGFPCLLALQSGLGRSRVHGLSASSRRPAMSGVRDPAAPPMRRTGRRP
jgi:hypothetical protein